MTTYRLWINNWGIRLLQHLLFWVLSFYVFLYLFKVGGAKPEKIDYIYTTLFHIFILPPVYINLELLIPWVRKTNYWISYLILAFSLITFFSWINFSFFARWSNFILPDYFFISYFNFLQVALFFIVYISQTSLLKLSKSWFLVSGLQSELLKAERLKSAQEKELLELEAKALRAQMNPHFIFNCMNSIKSLIQKNEHEKAIDYLTTFSKLVRTVFQNSDKREITLHDEIETCRLYTQLESMRFSNKLSYSFDIAEQTDFKSVMVPPLILQPFIENAIWHGLIPKTEGGVLYVRVTEKENKIYCIVEDDGIGRNISLQNQFKGTTSEHQSKGMRLTQTRLELNNTLNQRNATVEIIDKTNDLGEAAGTKVILVFDEE